MKKRRTPFGKEARTKRFQLRSIRSKIMLLLLGSVILTALAVSAVCIGETSRVMRRTAEDNMVLICERGADAINVQLEKIEEQVETLRHYAETALRDPSFVQNESERNRFLTEFEAVGQNHASSATGVLGVFVVFDTEALKLADPYGYSYVASGNGKFEKLPAYDLDAMQTLPDWYTSPHSTKKPHWLESAPHKDGAHGISYVSPILLPNGVCIGVVGVSCKSDMLKDASINFDSYESGFACILNSDNTILYHPTISPETDVWDRKNEFERIEGNALAEDAGVALYSYRLEGEQRYLTYATLRNGKRLCISISQQEIYDHQSSLVLSTVAIISGIVLVAFIAALLFTRRLTQPLMALNTAAKEMLEGKLDTELVPTTADEIGELTRILNRARERIKYQISDLYNEAHHDGLTGVPNKTAFRDIEHVLDRHIAYGTASFVLAILDVNRLKVTNDFFGHAAGDELLRSVANHLKATFDPQSVYRIGGDEFALLVQGEDTDEGIATIERCAAKIPSIRLPNFPNVQVSCAIGIVAYDKTLDTRFSDTLRRADQVMYRNKGDSKRRAAAVEGAKGLKQLQTEKFLEFLKILKQSTEDYLFLYEVESDKTHFFGKILEKYAIPPAEDGTVSLAAMTEAIYPADRAVFTEDIQDLIDGKKEDHDVNYRLTTYDGTPIWVNCRGRIIKADEQPFLLIGRLSDSILRPWYSPVTGLYNRTRFLQDMQEPKPPQFEAFMLVDIDNMSSLNLKLGRQAGDAMLRLIARSLEELFPQDRIYHMEKDRFSVLLHEQNEEALRERFAKLLASLDGKLSVSAAVVPHDDILYADENSIYEYANQLLKENKQRKAGSITFFTREDFQKRISNIDLLDELRNSIANNFEGFFVVYQPQIHANGYTVAGAEALLRYRSPSRGVVSPAEFIPILERTRLINKVGLFVCDTALAQCKLWRQALPHFHMAVNFSTVQLLEDATDERVIAMLAAHDLPGDALTIELTESVQLESAEVAEAFERFRSEGIRIAIDDFGTGYANLAYLKKIHADEIKIDRIFIKDIKASSYNYTVICNILDFAKQNGFHICLEGVETAEELSILEELGADTIQGFLFDRPISPEDFGARYLGGVPQWSFIGELARYKEQAHLVRFDTRDILSNIHIGLWVIYIDEENGIYKLYADDCMRDLLGVDATATPEECYTHWYSRIKPGHEDAVNAMVKAMAEGTSVQQTLYPWNHPTLGEIIVRCTGKCVRREDGITVFEGFHRNISETGNTYTHLADKH